MWPRALLQCGVTSNTSYPHHLLSPRAGSVPLPSPKFSCWLRKWERICEMWSGPEPNRAFPNLIRAPHSKIRLISKKKSHLQIKAFPSPRPTNVFPLTPGPSKIPFTGASSRAGEPTVSGIFHPSWNPVLCRNSLAQWLSQEGFGEWPRTAEFLSWKRAPRSASPPKQTQFATRPLHPLLCLWCLLLALELGNLPDGNVRNVNWCLLSDMNYLTPAAVSARLLELNLTVAVINFQSSKFA